MEPIPRLLVRVYLAACTVGIARIVFFPAVYAADRLGWKWPLRHKYISFLVSFLLVCGGIGFLAAHPIVTCPPEYEAQFTPELHQSVETHARGIYSSNIPSPSYSVAVESIQDGTVRFRTHYLFFGSTVTELGDDGFDTIKPLGQS